MSDNNGWPDQNRPGVPVNPKDPGYHWVAGKSAIFLLPVYWDGSLWLGDSQWTSQTFGADVYYLGPCLTPTEVETRVAEAKREEREGCAKACDAEEHRFPLHSLQHAGEIMTCRRLAAAIRARGEKE